MGDAKLGNFGSRRVFPFMWGLATLVSLLLHAPSFTMIHNEGDEVVYQGLASEMNWDLSRYSTAGIPQLRHFPFSIYRHPLSHQPPLYPLVLKLGQALHDPVLMGLLFNNLAMALLLYFAWRWAVLTGIPYGWAVASF